MEDNWIPVNEVAKMLGYRRQSLEKLKRDGRLEMKNIWKSEKQKRMLRAITKESLKKYIDQEGIYVDNFDELPDIMSAIDVMHVINRSQSLIYKLIKRNVLTTCTAELEFTKDVKRQYVSKKSLVTYLKSLKKGK